MKIGDVKGRTTEDVRAKERQHAAGRISVYLRGEHIGSHMEMQHHAGSCVGRMADPSIHPTALYPGLGRMDMCIAVTKRATYR